MEGTPKLPETERSAESVVGMTVGQVLHALLDLPPVYGDHLTRNALLQFTHDCETFYVIDDIEDLGEGGVCATLVPVNWRHGCDPARRLGGERAVSSAQSADYVRRSEVMETLLEAFDAIALAENYHQPEHVWMALRKAKGRIVDAIQGLQIDGDVSDAAL